MKTKNHNRIQIILILLLGEKIIQHTFVAATFFIAISGIGTPDIGTRLDISPPVMGVMNAVLAILFGCAIWGITADKQRSKTLILILGVFDIAAEFAFHGLFFITFSVVGAALLIILLLKYPIGNMSEGISL